MFKVWGSGKKQDKKKRPSNRRLAKKRVQCLNEVLCFVSSSVLADNLVIRNPLLRQAPNRYDFASLVINRTQDTLKIQRKLEW
jgi:hypothetical protein